jgi:hypothetical protein
MLFYQVSKSQFSTVLFIDSASLALAEINPDKVVRSCACIPNEISQISDGAQIGNLPARMTHQAGARNSCSHGNISVMLILLVCKSEFYSAIATSADNVCNVHHILPHAT